MRPPRRHQVQGDPRATVARKHTPAGTKNLFAARSTKWAPGSGFQWGSRVVCLFRTATAAAAATTVAPFRAAATDRKAGAGPAGEQRHSNWHAPLPAGRWHLSKRVAQRQLARLARLAFQLEGACLLWAEQSGCGDQIKGKFELPPPPPPLRGRGRAGGPAGGRVAKWDGRAYWARWPAFRLAN